MNTDEALKCLKLAQRYRDAGNYASAQKFAQKSINLYSTPEAIKLLAIIKAEAEGSSSSEPSTSSSKASGAESHPSASTTHSRTTGASPASASESSSGTKKATYTQDQVKLVRRVRACKVTEYYEILELEKSCEEADVKRAYRKLALQLHPDKNGAPGADEAFKMVSKAFQILSDSQKRAVFDQSGGDPDSRFAGATPGMARGFAGGRQFDGEVSPEDLFNMFFGGGMGGQMGGGFGGGPFGGGPVFTASFGPGGFRTTRVRRAGAAANAADAGEPQSPRSILLQLAPLLVIFLFSLITSLPSLFTTPPPPDPTYTFSPHPPYTSERLTSQLNIPYYVSPSDFSAHHIWTTIPDSHKNIPKAGAFSRELGQFEHGVERRWTNEMVRRCERERDEKERKIEAKTGWLGVGADWEAVKRIRREKLESCEKLKAKNIISQY